MKTPAIDIKTEKEIFDFILLKVKDWKDFKSGSIKMEFKLINLPFDSLEMIELGFELDEFLNIEEEIDHTIFFEDQTLKDLCSRIHTLQLK